MVRVDAASAALLADKMNWWATLLVVVFDIRY